MGTQATAMMQATTRAAEMPETVLREIREKLVRTAKFREKILRKTVKITFFLSDSYLTIGSPVLLVRYFKSNSIPILIFCFFLVWWL